MNIIELKNITFAYSSEKNVFKGLNFVLKEGEKTIPQIAEEINEPLDMVTYSLMTSRKYGDIETGEIDDMDEYFTYKIAKKTK